MIIKIFWRWVVDYFYGLRTLTHALFFRLPEKSVFRGDYGKNPVIVIPGIMQKWNVFRQIIKLLNAAGHPVYVVADLKRNLLPIPAAAGIVRKFIEQQKLRDVVILAHSRGGLIGKYLLAYLNADGRVSSLLAIATPFKGTERAAMIPLAAYREMSPDSEIIKNLAAQSRVNGKITCIYCAWDNLVKPLESCVLEGAKNIQLGVWGHQRMLFQKITKETILKEIEKDGNPIHYRQQN